MKFTKEAQKEIDENKKILDAHINIMRRDIEEQKRKKQSDNKEANKMNYVQQQKLEVSKKSTGLAFVLWFFLGGFGAHRFYAGFKKSAIVIALLNIFALGCLFFAIGDAGQAAVEIVQQQQVHESSSFPYVAGLILIPLYFWILVDAFKLSGWIKTYNLNLIEKFSKSN